MTEHAVSAEASPRWSRRGWLSPVPPAAVMVLAGLLTGYVALAVLVVTGWVSLLAADHTAVLAAHHAVLDQPGLLAGARVATAFGSPLAVDVVSGVIGVILLVGRRWRAALYLVAARLLELALETLTKDLVARPRPVLPDPVAQASGFSFPSGHAAGSAAVYGAVLVLAITTTSRSRRPARRAGLVAFGIAVVVLVAAVAASRVLLGVHNPSDVTAGALLGGACVIAALPLHRLSRPAAHPGHRPDAQTGPPTPSSAGDR